MTRRKLFAAALTAALSLSSAATAQHGAPPPKGATNTMQPGAAEWIADPHMHAFYDTTVAAFAGGPGKVDVDGYEQKCFAIFRAFAPSMGMTPGAMQDHLKLIPRQVVKIVRDDPHVLDNYKNFVDATFGPR